MTFTTLRQRVEALPEPERSARWMLHTDKEWEEEWELNAYPHQIPPIGDDWHVWTVIGSRRVGKTMAGYKWMESKFLYSSPNDAMKFLILTHHKHDMDRIRKMLYDKLLSMGIINEFHIRTNGDHTSFEVSSTRQKLTMMSIAEDRSQVGAYRLMGTHYDYVWADEIQDADMLVRQLHTAKKFVFTQPTKLPAETLLSRAYDSGGPY